MNTFIEKLRSNKNGFTIIEVMIVLALAGLIIAAVIVAVPQLQRNQRNSVRRSVLARIKAEVDNYSGNNNGTIPASGATGNADTAGNFGSATTQTVSFAGRYLKSISINDPSTGNTVGLDSNIALATDPGLGIVKYYANAQCGTDGAMVAGAGNRTYAVSMGLEGGSVYCLDNK